ncbi:MAG: lysozyme inhibitor LprI family protein [Desulfobacter sp.]
MEEIADNSEKCNQCNSDLMKPCPYCREKIKADAMKCKHCGSELNASQQQQQQVPPQYQQSPPQQATAQQPLPPGVAGWSWGAALLNWIWAIGNKVWIGLLALIPVVSIVMFFVLGFKGREWAWKSGQWESVDHFNRVQKKWSQWAVGLTLVGFIIGIIGAVAMPQFSNYRTKGHNSAAMSDLKNAKTNLEAYFADNQRYPDTLEASKFVPSKNVYIKCSILPDAYVCGAAHKEGTIMYVSDNTGAQISEESYAAGNPIQLPYDPRPAGSAKADEYNTDNTVPGMTFTPSFDCTKASTGAERMICSNQELAQADVGLAQVYKAALSKASDKAALKNEQGNWIRTQRDTCSDAACMLDAYQTRTTQLLEQYDL